MTPINHLQLPLRGSSGSFPHSLPIAPARKTKSLGGGPKQQKSLPYTPEHCLVNGGFPPFWVRKRHVSSGCKMLIFSGAPNRLLSSWLPKGREPPSRRAALDSTRRLWTGRKNTQRWISPWVPTSVCHFEGLKEGKLGGPKFANWRY